MGWNYTLDLYNLINIQVKINMLFKMMLDTFYLAWCLRGYRCWSLTQTGYTYQAIQFPVRMKSNASQECFLEFCPVLEVAGKKVHLEQDVKQLIFIEVFCQWPANLYWIFPTRNRLLTLCSPGKESQSAAGSSAGVLTRKKVKHAPYRNVGDSMCSGRT